MFRKNHFEETSLKRKRPYRRSVEKKLYFREYISNLSGDEL
jgi:hypothetical protein